MATIPVMKPKLVSTEHLSPYLKRIDSSRFYSNFGPLARLLEDRLCAHYGLGNGTATMVANRTLGLVLALSAQNPRPGSLCLLPAWTFVASAQAVMMAGLVPYFVDVNLETWMLDVSTVASEMANAPGTVGAVMPVSAFGRPIDISEWDQFGSRSGVAVVIDAAAVGRFPREDVTRSTRQTDKQHDIDIVGCLLERTPFTRAAEDQSK